MRTGAGDWRFLPIVCGSHRVFEFGHDAMAVHRLDNHRVMATERALDACKVRVGERSRSDGNGTHLGMSSREKR